MFFIDTPQDFLTIPFITRAELASASVYLFRSSNPSEASVVRWMLLNKKACWHP